MSGKVALAMPDRRLCRNVIFNRHSGGEKLFDWLVYHLSGSAVLSSPEPLCGAVAGFTMPQYLIGFHQSINDSAVSFWPDTNAGIFSCEEKWSVVIRCCRFVASMQHTYPPSLILRASTVSKTLISVHKEIIVWDEKMHTKPQKPCVSGVFLCKRKFPNCHWRYMNNPGRNPSPVRRMEITNPFWWKSRFR